MFMKNKKGFTLVELLATIVILAILITTAVTVVLPIIERARKNAFITEAKEYMKAARSASVDNALENEHDTEATTSCFEISELTGEYVKNDKGNYSGTVTIDNTVQGAPLETISITNGKYYIVATNEITKQDVKKEMPADYVASCTTP